LYCHSHTSLKAGIYLAIFLYKIHKTEALHTLIVARINKKGEVCLAKPCLGCYSKIKELNFEDVFYTDQKGNLCLLDTSLDLERYEYFGIRKQS
jgi:hypothetical protein